MNNSVNHKFWSLVIIASLSGILLTGCAQKKSNDPIDDGKVEIGIYHCTFNISSADTNEVKAIEEAINDYIDDKINVKIRLTDIGQGEYTEKCNLAIANGETNLFWTANWKGADSLVPQNAVYDLSELLPGTVLYESIPDSVWKSSRYNGHDYFIPCYKEASEGYDIVYPTAKAEKYGFDPSSIKKLKDLEPILEKMKEDGVKYPFLLQKMTAFSRFYLDDYDFIASNSMFAVDRKTNKIVNCLNLPEYREFVSLMGTWVEKGYISSEEAAQTIPDTAINTTDWGFAIWWDVPINEVASYTYNQDCNIIKMTKNYINSNSTLGSCFGVTSSSSEEEAKACIDFMGLMYTDSKLATLFTYGIEGTDYEMKDGLIEKKGELYNHSPWESGSVTVIPPAIGEPKNKKDIYEAFNKEAETSIANGFRVNFDSVASTWAACLSLYNKYGYTLETGGYSAEEVDAALDKYRSELDSAGYQEILTLAENQYNTWKELQ